mgnify:CR=1 FL=1
MNDNAYRTRSERGEIQLGTWVTMIRTPAVLTLLQAAGLDFVRVDMEHSPFSMETVADMATLAPRAGLSDGRPAARGQSRVDHSPARRRRVESPRAAGRHARASAGGRRVRHYAPLGERGMYGFGPHTGYRTLPHRRAHGRAPTPACTSPPCWRRSRPSTGWTRSSRCPASTHSRSARRISPRTSACSARRRSVEVLTEYRRRLAEACRKHGKAVAMITDSVEGVREMIGLGATIINYSSDTAILRAGYAAMVDAVKKQSGA